MKNFILMIVLALVSAPCFANDCSSGVCRKPVRRTLSKVVDVTSALVVAPVRATKNVVNNVRSRSLARRSHR